MNSSISVIIPAYNRFRMLVTVVESILSQTCRVDEIVVVDDGSEDETPEEMPRCIAERPGWNGRVRYIRQENQGQSAALNHGIAKSRGQWLGFCAHDDLWLPWKLEWQFKALKQYAPECGLCFTDAWFMNNPHMKQTVFQFAHSDLRCAPVGIVTHPLTLVVGQHPVWVQTTIARRDLVEKSDCFDPFLRYSEDHDFVFRMALVTRFCYVNLPLVLIDRSPADVRHVGASEDWHRVEYTLQMEQYRYEKQLRLAGRVPGVGITIRRNLRALHSHWATYYLTRRDFAAAREHLRIACSYEYAPRTVLKRALTSVVPKLARSIFVAHDQHGSERYDRSSWREPSSELE